MNRPDDDDSTVPAPLDALAGKGSAPMPLPPVVPKEDPAEAAQRRERLDRINGLGELRAALLALLLTQGSARELGVWQDETQGVPQADLLRRELRALPSPQRLPWLERFAERMSMRPVAEKQQLLQSARRMMAADGRTDATDRLRWLTLRHLLAGAPGSAQNRADVEVEGLDDYIVQSIGKWSAFLSRLVPSPELDLDISADIAEPGALWWRAVMAPWASAGTQRRVPDSGELVAALQGVQTVPWMLRPAIVKRWLDAALVLSPPDRLHPAAADALRMAVRLLDTPLPPTLARNFVEWDGRSEAD
jgi:hypothetical protein